jgi:hypothetical protein
LIQQWIFAMSSKRKVSNECESFLSPVRVYLQLCHSDLTKIHSAFERISILIHHAPTQEIRVELCLLLLEFFESSHGVAFLKKTPAVREAVIKKVMEFSRDPIYGHLFRKILFNPDWVRMYIHDGCQEILATPALRRKEDLKRLQCWKIK